MTGLIASIVEAYGELRVNKARILLSLLGVAFSVFALTAVLGAGGMLRSSIEQTTERWAGRPTVLTVQSVGGAENVSAADRDRVVLEQVERLGIEHRSRMMQTSLRLQTKQGVKSAQAMAVDPAYGDMYRIRVHEGRWLADNDAYRLAPALVANEALYDMLGRPELGTETVTVRGTAGMGGMGGPASGETRATPAVVIGVTRAMGPMGDGPMAYVSAGALGTLVGDAGSAYGMSPSYLAWVPPELADQVTLRLGESLRDTPAGRFETYSQGMMMGDTDPFRTMELGVLAVALVILALGALGLINISMVTVRYRVREIGIRRSYGATGLRIFFGVLMESVVATVVAGALGVAAAVALVRSPMVQNFFIENGLVDIPPFPVTAVVAGLAAAVIVGIIAGALPAIVATRIKVIDAIRA
ncbi:MAG: ABC transporter permease [Mobilicoccus sp.]|nr:ABC transporter permease [Mobilicoccus sp.]